MTSHTSRAAVTSLAFVAAAVLLMALPAAASAVPGMPTFIVPRASRRVLLQTGFVCVTTKCAAQLPPCQAKPTCLSGLLCANACLSKSSPNAYVACASRCIYKFFYGDAAAAALNRCILANKCAGSKFPKATCPAVKKAAASVAALRGTYSLVRSASVADRDPAKYSFAAKAITLRIAPAYIKPKTVQYTLKLVSGNKYSGAIAGIPLGSTFYVLAATKDRKFLVVGYCGVATSVLVLSASGAQPSAAVSKVLAAGLAASGWGAKYPYSKLAKVATF